MEAPGLAFTVHNEGQDRMGTASAVGVRVTPSAGSVNGAPVFRVTGHPPVSIDAASRIEWLIRQHDKPAAGVTRGPLRRAIMRELNATDAAAALNLARQIAKHARRANLTLTT